MLAVKSVLPRYKCLICDYFTQTESIQSNMLSHLTKSAAYTTLHSFDQCWLIEQLYRMWLQSEDKNLGDLNEFNRIMRQFHCHGAYMPTPDETLCWEESRNMDRGREMVYLYAIRRLQNENQFVPENDFVDELAAWLLKPAISAQESPLQFFRHNSRSLLRRYGPMRHAATCTVSQFSGWESFALRVYFNLAFGSSLTSTVPLDSDSTLADPVNETIRSARAMYRAANMHAVAELDELDKFICKAISDGFLSLE